MTGPAFAWAPYLLLWAGLVIGGAAGALAYSAFGLRALLIPVVAALALAAATGIGRGRAPR